MNLNVKINHRKGPKDMAEDQITLELGDPRLYERGMSVAHSSDDGGLPDIGKSVGLGGAMLYAGERPGKPGWCLSIYFPEDDILEIAEGLPSGSFSAAADLVDLVAMSLCKASS